MEYDLNQPDFKEVQPIGFPNKTNYLYDIDNILFADTGRVDAMSSNIFFRESGQLLHNAIFLFEKGFFDCAFYSLRQSVEISITTLFLTSNKGKAKEWNNLEPGFEKGKMIAFLKNHESDFEDIRIKMKDYFNQIGETIKSIDKYVHKQGYKTFYTIRNSYNAEKKYPKESLIADFEKCLDACIGMVAINRLSIDPIPILLMDEKILRKMRPMMAESFSETFVLKYLGEKNIDLYKQTNVYMNYYRYFDKLESQNEAIHDIIHCQYIDTEKPNEILAQVHLLDIGERVACMLFFISKEIYSVFTNDGEWYFSKTKSKMKDRSVTIGQDYYQSFFKSRNNFNEIFDEVYISRCFVDKGRYFFLHNERLSEIEIEQIEIFSSELTNKVQAVNDEFPEQFTANEEKYQHKNL